jgi:CubicO group peptidase (beta-lactamase class C family)
MVKSLIIALLAACLCAPTLVGLAAATTMPEADTLSSAGTPALNAADLQAFFGGQVPDMLKRSDIAGGVVVVVKDGKLIFAQGYGQADVAAHKPVVADRTLFRLGAISKTLTWTAVMQMVGEGKIDLDADVNRYLDFKIPEKFGRPITMRDLMTQTSGFEETFAKEFVPSTAQLFPLDDYLREHLPSRIFPPGKILAYSNYNASLAGYIVQRVSGEPVDQYLARHILDPLGMDHSTFAQPLPAALALDMSVGYHAASNKQSIPFEAVEISPAGGMTSTGTDMARFMISQLENGQFEGISILSPAMIALMHAPQSVGVPGMNGFTLGFYQENRNGLRIIGHTGDTIAFHSDMHLLLDKHVGLFVAFNSEGRQLAVKNIHTALFRAFLDRYYPYTPPQQVTVADPQRDAARVAGWYMTSRRLQSSLSLIYAPEQTHVTANPDGTIQIDALTDADGAPKNWREVGPLIYREVGGSAHTKFLADKDGRILYWNSDDLLPQMVFQPVRGLQSLGALVWMVRAFIVLLLLTLAIWIGGALVRRCTRTTLTLTRNQFRWRLASRVGMVLLLLLLGGWSKMPSYIFYTANDELDGFLTGLYLLGVLATIGAFAMLIEAVLRVVRGPGGWLVRTGEAVLGLGALYALWGIAAYSLINFSYTY